MASVRKIFEYSFMRFAWIAWGGLSVKVSFSDQLRSHCVCYTCCNHLFCVLSIQIFHCCLRSLLEIILRSVVILLDQEVLPFGSALISEICHNSRYSLREWIVEISTVRLWVWMHRVFCRSSVQGIGWWSGWYIWDLFSCLKEFFSRFFHRWPDWMRVKGVPVLPAVKIQAYSDKVLQ